MAVEIIYDSDEELLTFFNNGFEICTTTVEAFNAEYSRVRSSLDMNFMPLAIRGIFKSSGDNLRHILYQTRPQYRQFNFSPLMQSELSPNDQSDQTRYLPMPWMLFCISVNAANNIVDIRGFITVDYSGNYKNQPLYQIPLHNWYNDNLLCRPAYNEFEVDTNTDLISIINRAHEEIWSSGFNNDLHDCVDYYIGNIPKFSFIPDEYRNSLYETYKKNNLRAYELFYSLWANATMDEIMKSGWLLVGHYDDHLGFIHDGDPDYDNHDSVSNAIDYDYIATLLSTAQNSSE